MPSLSRRELLAAWLLAAAGCQTFDWNPSEMFNLRSQSPDDDEPTDPLSTKVETALVGKYTRASGLNVLTVQGVGLVVGLDGTGDDPPPSAARQALLEEMRRNDVPNPNQILKSPNTALVIVQAAIPPLAKKGERFDVDVRLLGDDRSSSLNGGWLMPCYLTEQAMVPGAGILKGGQLARAEGPIMITASDEDSASISALMRRGKILGGGAFLKEDRVMHLYLNSDFQSVRNAYRIATRVGERFYTYDEANIRVPLAEAKTDAKIELKIVPRYKDNYPRYLQVIRHIAFQENPVARRVRMQKLRDRLNNPVTSEEAALELEAIGPEAIPILKTGLENRALEVRFHSAMALAYMEDPSGLKHLDEAARTEPAFRIYALAAMAAIDEAESHVLLRNLMNCDDKTYGDSAETRYGAFRALSTLDPNDPFIRGEMLPPDEPQFHLHVLETTGAPMVHLCKYRKAEIVLFGADQRLKLPLAVRAGLRVLITGQAGSDTVKVSRHATVEVDGVKRVQNSSRNVSTRLDEVIRAAAELGATYPDIAQMLVQADAQHNLPGRLEIDVLPRAGRVYIRPDLDGDQKRARVGSSRLAPNIYGGTPDGESKEPTTDTSGAETEAPEKPEAEIPVETLKERKWYDPRRYLEPETVVAEEE